MGKEVNTSAENNLENGNPSKNQGEVVLP